MKPDPYHAPIDKPLTEMQRMILRASTAPVEGSYPVGLKGAGQFTAARSLVAMGLGNLDGKAFTANARGAAAVRDQ